MFTDKDFAPAQTLNRPEPVLSEDAMNMQVFNLQDAQLFDIQDEHIVDPEVTIAGPRATVAHRRCHPQNKRIDRCTTSKL